MAPMTNRIKFLKYIWGLIIETINFAFEVKAILGLEVLSRLNLDKMARGIDKKTGGQLD